MRLGLKQTVNLPSSEMECSIHSDAMPRWLCQRGDYKLSMLVKLVMKTSCSGVTPRVGSSPTLPTLRGGGEMADATTDKLNLLSKAPIPRNRVLKSS